MTHPRTDSRPLAIALMGPTAAGKTALAVEWAQRLGGEIVSVDSALVYRGMDIGSAKPDAETLACAPHHLLDLRDPHETYSAADFALDARVHGSVAAALIAAQNGAKLLRVHDVAATVDALKVWNAVAAQTVPKGKSAPTMPKWPDDD